MLRRTNSFDLTDHLDIAVGLPASATVRITARLLFGTLDNPLCQRFLRRVGSAEEQRNLSISAKDSGHRMEPNKLLVPCISG